MKNKTFEIPGKVTVEYDSTTKTYIASWLIYLGPHFRKALYVIMEDVKRTGLENYIANSSQATDVPPQEDFQFGESTFAPALIAAGIRRFITVVPASAIAKMGANRCNRIATAAPGVDAFRVASIDEAITLTKSPLPPK